MNPIIMAILFCVILAIILVVEEYLHKQTSYYKITGNSLWNVRRDKGKTGEYLIYKKLKKYERTGTKFLFNCYLNKNEAETTELDVVMIHTSGIYVFESKNYSGWIFGNDKQKMWTQTLSNGKGKSHKEHFYNPIWQNYGHIETLKKYIGENIPIYSIIVFSDRCELKDITVSNDDVVVIKRDKVPAVVEGSINKNGTKITQGDIDNIYTKLYSGTTVSDEVKQKHIDDINNIKDTKGTKETKNAKNIKEEKDAENINNIKNTNDISDAKDINVVKDTNVVKDMNCIKDINNVKEVNDIKGINDINNVKEVNDIKGINDVKDTSAANNIKICPRCGGKLIEREAGKGEFKGNKFWGCENFPKCRYIQNEK